MTGGGHAHGESWEEQGVEPECAAWPSVSVIVVAHNSRAHLDACLTSIIAQRYEGPLDVVLVDNASTDDSASHVAARFADVHVIGNALNAGYGGGCNLGARQSQGEVLVFLNPDTETAPGAVRALVKTLLQDPGVGLVTPVLVHFDRRDQINTAGNRVHLSAVTTCRLANRPTSDARDAEVPAVSGACFAVRRELFERLGGVDEEMFMYLEDTDLSWRVRLAGYCCRLVSEAVVAHHYALRLGAEKTFWLERNRYHLLAKNLSLSGALALAPLLLLTEIITLGWAAQQGPRHLAAKLRAYGWAIRQLPSIGVARRLVQRSRVHADRAILRQHAIALPFEEVAGGPVGKLASRAMGPLVGVAGRAALAIVGVDRA